MRKKVKHGSGRLKLVASDVPDTRPRRALPHHTLGLKSNLVSTRNAKDIYPCVHCGREFKYGLDRPPTVEGKCMVSVDIYESWDMEQATACNRPFGWWSDIPVAEAKCYKCGAEVGLVPREGHVLSGAWKHERDDGAVFVHCPDGCTEG